MKKNYYTPITTCVTNIVSLSALMASGPMPTPSFSTTMTLGSLQFSGKSGSISGGV